MSGRNPGSDFSGGFFGCFGVLGAVVVVFLLFSVGFCSPETKAPQQLSETAEPLPTAETVPSGFEDQAVLAARRESSEQARQTASDVKAFYYRGEPTACGVLTSTHGTERFMYRNGNAVVEHNHQRDVFNEFWQICQAAGVLGS